MAIKVNFNQTVGKMKPMHGTGGGPRQGGSSLGVNVTSIFQEIGVPFCRLHDIEGAYAQNQYVDVHCIFPDFNADETDPESYNFKPTDKYLQGIIDAGSTVFYRLGETIDHYPKKLFVRPPKDTHKWARICEHIIRHYNYGWANGFKWNIQYWEIWNEPDNFRMWTGDLDDFYKVYKVTATHLKKCFPELKIGGYSASGFYTETRPIEKCGEWFRTLVPWTNNFFEKLSKEPERVPMDFFSWHCYANRPEEINLFANYVQELLKKYGYQDAESILTEYNTMDSLGKPVSTLPYYASDLGAGLITAQNSPMDGCIYYDMRIHGMNGVFARDIYFKIVRLHGFYAMKFFGDLYRLKNQTELNCEYQDVYALSASDGEKGGIMLAVRKYSGEVEMELEDCKAKSVIVSESEYEKELKTFRVPVQEGKVLFTAKEDALYYIDVE